MNSSRRRPVVDVALHSAGVPVPVQADRAQVLQRLRRGDIAFRWLTRGAAIAVLLILGGIIISLVYGSWPALRSIVFDFL